MSNKESVHYRQTYGGIPVTPSVTSQYGMVDWIAGGNLFTYDAGLRPKLSKTAHYTGKAKAGAEAEEAIQRSKQRPRAETIIVVCTGRAGDHLRGGLEERGVTGRRPNTHGGARGKDEPDDHAVKGGINVYNRTSFCDNHTHICLLYTSPRPRDKRQSRMPSSA